MGTEALLAALRRSLPGAIDARDGRAVLLPRSETELGAALRLGRELGARMSPPGAEARGAVIEAARRAEPPPAASEPEHHEDDVESARAAHRSEPPSAVLRAVAEQGREHVPTAKVPAEAVAASAGAAPIAIDLQRMATVLGFDDASRILHVQAGCTLATVERELGARGLTLGGRELPLEIDVGTWLALGAPGAPAAADDPVSHLVAGLSVVWPDGSLAHVRPAPRRAVGPDLIGALIGARGRLGVITAVHLAAREKRSITPHSFQMASAEAAHQALAWIRGRGVRPHAARIDGALLHLELASDGPLAGAWLAAVLRTVDERGGVPVTAPADARPAVFAAQPPARIVDMLARELDPRGVLSQGGMG